GAQEVNMGVGRHPALLAPLQRSCELERQVFRTGVDRHRSTHGSGLVAACDLHGYGAEWQVDDAVAVHVRELVIVDGEIGEAVLEQSRGHLAVMSAWRKVLAGSAMKM